MLRNGPFLKSMLLIGVPAKAVLTGVLLFALPLLLTKHDFAREDIGQMTMVYAGAVILASSLVSTFVDRTRQTERVLVAGGVLTAVGLIIISAVGFEAISGPKAHPILQTVILIIGVTIVGIAHGFINAPVVTHVAESKIASELGVANVASTYRLVERVGPHDLARSSWGRCSCILRTLLVHHRLDRCASMLLLTILFPSDGKAARFRDNNHEPAGGLT